MRKLQRFTEYKTEWQAKKLIPIPPARRVAVDYKAGNINVSLKYSICRWRFVCVCAVLAVCRSTYCCWMVVVVVRLWNMTKKIANLTVKMHHTLLKKPVKK